MPDDISVSAAPIGATENTTPSSPSVDSISPSSSDVVKETPKETSATFEDFDENQIPESSRENFRKYRETQTKKTQEIESKLNAETRRRMEYEAQVSDFQARQRASQNVPVQVGEKPDYRQFATIEEYGAALEKWAKTAAASEYTTRQQQERQQRALQEEAAKMQAKGNAARMKYADFDQVVKPIVAVANQIQPLMMFMQEFDNGTDVLYHLGKNPAVLETLAKMQPFAAGQELLRIQAALSAPTPRAVSQAPAPINPVNSGGDGSVRSVLEQVKKEDVSDFVARENRKLMRGKRGE